jgi:hypothetical protein
MRPHGLSGHDLNDEEGDAPPVISTTPDGVKCSAPGGVPAACLTPPDIRQEGDEEGDAPPVISTTPNGVERSTSKEMRLMWLSGVGFMAALLLMPVRPDTEYPAKPITYGLATCVFLLFGSLYVKRFFVSQRLKMLQSSIIAWQIVLALSVNTVVTIACAPADEMFSKVFSASLTFLGMLATIVLDLCEATRFESAVCLALLVLAGAFAVFGNHYLWSDEVIFKGYRVSNQTGLSIGSWTQNEVRRTAMMAILALVASSVKDFLKDREFLRMYYCKECRVKPDVLDGSRGEIRTGVHFTIIVSGTCTVVWLTLRYALHSAEPKAYLVAIYWVVMVIMFCCMAMFTWSFIVVQRIRHLLTSLLAWQVVILLSIYCGVTIAYGDQRRSAERTPAAIIILLNFVFVVALDVCRTSIWESYFYLTLMTVGTVLGLFGNLFLFDDEVVLTSLTEVSNIRRIPSLQCTSQPHSSLLSVLPTTYQLL